jgi:hypothetical protein
VIVCNVLRSSSELITLWALCARRDATSRRGRTAAGRVAHSGSGGLPVSGRVDAGRTAKGLSASRPPVLIALSAPLDRSGHMFDRLVECDRGTMGRLPAPLIADVAASVSLVYTHSKIDNVFKRNGAPGDPPVGTNKRDKVTSRAVPAYVRSARSDGVPRGRRSRWDPEAAGTCP